MTDINSDLLERVQKLPIKQRQHFEELVAGGEDNPRETAEQLREGLIDGTCDPHFQMTTILAAAALSDSHTPDRFPTEEQARGGYRNEIRRLREIDPDDPVATHLEAMLVKLSKREVADQARAETVTADAKQHRLKVEQEKRDAFQKAYDDHKASRIAELSRFDLMDAEQAEKRFLQVEHDNIQQSLMRLHGIA